jgi:hypothetical protein
MVEAGNSNSDLPFACSTGINAMLEGGLQALQADGDVVGTSRIRMALPPDLLGAQIFSQSV